MSGTPSTIETPEVATDVAALEAAWRMPAVEPTRPAHAATRRAATVADAVRAGYTASEMFTVLLFAVLIGGLVAMVVLGLN